MTIATLITPKTAAKHNVSFNWTRYFGWESWNLKANRYAIDLHRDNGQVIENGIHTYKVTCPTCGHTNYSSKFSFENATENIGCEKCRSTISVEAVEIPTRWIK